MYKFRINYLFRVAAILYLALYSYSAHAAQNSAHYGGSGGNKSYNLDCGKNGAIVGFEARRGLFLDQVGIHCRKIRPNGTLGEIYSRGPVGGMGGSGESLLCSNGYIASYMYIQYGSYITRFEFQCRKWDSNKKRFHKYTSKNFEFRDHQKSPLNMLDKKGSFGCRPMDGNYVLKKISGKYGNYIDSMKVTCRRWDN